MSPHDTSTPHRPPHWGTLVAKTDAGSDGKGGMVDLTPFTLLLRKSVLPVDCQFRDDWRDSLVI
jgi:hypothetical protein